MSIQINIGLGDDNVSTDALDRHMAALGFTRHVVMTLVHPDASPARAVAPNGEPDSSGVPGGNTVEPAKRTRKKADDKPAISTNPEDRKPPEDDAETVAQDAADEAAEVEANREPEKPLTVDDVKNAVGLYVARFGLAETQEDGAAVFLSALGKPPGNEPFWKLSLFANAAQDQLAKAIVAWKTAAAAEQRFVAKGA